MNCDVKILRMIFAFVSLSVSLASCSKDSVSPGPSSNTGPVTGNTGNSEPLQVWDENSLKILVRKGGKGRRPIISFDGPRPGDQICQLRSKNFGFDSQSRVLRMDVCEDIYKKRAKHKKQLSKKDSKDLQSAMTSLRSERKWRNGSPCPADFTGNSIHYIDVIQKDGTSKIFDDDPNLCGKEDPEFVFGGLPDMSFTKKMESHFEEE